MNDQVRLPLIAFCVAGIAGLTWIGFRGSDLAGLFAAVAVISAICGFAGMAAALMDSGERN
jgi:hypothetical protein